jgi:hypothetical protein
MPMLWMTRRLYLCSSAAKAFWRISTNQIWAEPVQTRTHQVASFVLGGSEIAPHNASPEHVQPFKSTR